MGLMVKFRKQREIFSVDFADILVHEMVEQLVNLKSHWRFRYTSFLDHMFLHQNPELFKETMELSMYDNRNKKNLVTVWTHLLSTTYNAYTFLDAFLALAM